MKQVVRLITVLFLSPVALAADTNCPQGVVEFMSLTTTPTHSSQQPSVDLEQLLIFKQLLDLNVTTLGLINADRQCIGTQGMSLVCEETKRILAAAADYTTEFTVKNQDPEVWSPRQTQTIESLPQAMYLHYVLCVFPQTTAIVTLIYTR